MAELLLLIIGLVGFWTLDRRQRALAREVERLQDRLMQLDPAIAPQAVERVQSIPAVVAPVEAEAAPAPEPQPEWEPEAPLAARERQTFESLVGGKLPIWTGGAALVVAGFFLVRYSIESGLLGPAVRTLLAALFSLVLIAASEFARAWAPTRDDPRVGQALAGAGVASAYGTLYIAAAQYDLVGPAAGFAMMVAITVAALVLALRHGPPTAVMALIGGFAAPLVAGFDAAGIGALLAYLALFTTALFALAIRRGWTWLALASVVAGFGWANLILVALNGDGAGGVAAFATALAIGATLAVPRTGEGRPWLRALPLVAGLLQLLVLVPTLDFSAIGWSFYLVLSAAALVLAWRDRALLPAATGAPALVLVLLAGGLFATPVSAATQAAAVTAALLFGGVGFALSRRASGWVWIALAGIVGPVLVAHWAAGALLPALGWSALELLAGAAAAALAWRHRDRAGAGDTGFAEGATAAAALVAIALATPLDPRWAGLPVAGAMATLALLAHRAQDTRLAARPVLFLAALIALAAEPLTAFAETLAASLSGYALTYPTLPAVADAVLLVGLPAVAVLALLRLPGAFGATRRPAAAIGAVLALLACYALTKQPLRVETDAAFVARGIVERAGITLLILGAGWWLARRERTRAFALPLVGLAIARIVVFDLLLQNPVAVRQAVGALPIVNAAVLLPALTAAALATLPAAGKTWRVLSLAAMVLAVGAAVRQIAHGSLLTGPLGTGENWGYSAAFLGLAIAWLAVGIRRSGRGLRIAGLALLTLVTLKVFLIDVAALGGLLRILSFLGLGVALIGIGWAYGRVLAPRRASEPRARGVG